MRTGRSLFIGLVYFSSANLLQRLSWNLNHSLPPCSRQQCGRVTALCLSGRKGSNKTQPSTERKQTIKKTGIPSGSPCGEWYSQGSADLCPDRAESLVFTGDSRRRGTLALVHPRVMEAKPARTVSPLPSELGRTPAKLAFIKEAYCFPLSPSYTLKLHV